MPQTGDQIGGDLASVEGAAPQIVAGRDVFGQGRLGGLQNIRGPGPVPQRRFQMMGADRPVGDPAESGPQAADVALGSPIGLCRFSDIRLNTFAGKVFFNLDLPSGIIPLVGRELVVGG